MDDGEIQFRQALALQADGHWSEALTIYEALLQARPELNAVRNNLAVCLNELGRPNEALAVLAPLAQNHAPPEMLTNRGNALRALGRFAEAEAAYALVVNSTPMDAMALSNLALSLQDQGKLQEAVKAFERACAMMPGDASLRANLGGALLMAGDFAKGFAAHEFRLAGSATEAAMKACGLPLWDGKPLNGRRLLVWTEQGLGDSLQFLRFLPGLDGKATVMAQGALMRLVQSVGNVEAVYGWNDVPPTCDVQIALLSLARLMNCKSETDIPPSGLVPDPLLKDLWGQRLSDLNRPRIGLSWQGNPAMKADKARSVGLGQLKPLFDVPGVNWISLQTGDVGGQIEGLGLPLLDLGREISDLADTAAIMAHLDLVIAIDSAAAHLAGSLGRPTWIMVRANPDWRWPPKAENTPWYPQARLWRQQRLGDWKPIVEAMASALPTFLRGLG
ncbi:MAG: tetratricopeptide repeat protein [Alphaproteobacteria bacterium]|nr:tetratricopeptide repeat protein [Alphaproteobacteria bacterium]